MSIRMCYVCDQPIGKGEARSFVGTLAIHEYCDPDIQGKTCNVEDCGYRWTIHAGECL